MQEGDLHLLPVDKCVFHGTKGNAHYRLAAINPQHNSTKATTTRMFMQIKKLMCKKIVL